MVKFYFRFYCVLLFFLSIPLYALPVVPLPTIVSFAFKTELPTQNTDTKILFDSKILRASAKMENKTEFSHFSPEIYTWNLSFKPLYGVQILGGSIAVSGLPARVRNLVNPLITPVFRPVISKKGKILSPGITRNTESFAIELYQDDWGVAVFLNTNNFPEENTWVYTEFSMPTVLPFDTSINLSLFSGIHNFPQKKETTWFFTSQQRPPALTLFPAAELIVSNRNFTVSATVLGNIPQLQQNSGALRSDAAIRLGWLSIAALYFHSAVRFTEFDGSVPDLRERRLLAPSITIPIPGTRRLVFRSYFLYAQDILTPNQFEQVYEVRRWYGSRLSLENTQGFAQGTAIYKTEHYCFSGKASAYRFIFPWLRASIAGKASLPEDNFSRRAWVNQDYRILFSVKTRGKTRNARVSCEGIMTQKDRYSPIAYGVSGTLAGTITTKHIQQTVSTECTISTENPKYSAAFYLHTQLR